MTKSNRSSLLVVAAALALASGALAQDAPRYRPGETSPGTQAPHMQQIMDALSSGSPDVIYSTLEYAERVECHQCIPAVAQNLYSPNARIREISAWWLRHRIFGFPLVFGVILDTLHDASASADRRQYAAEALGEFQDPNAVPDLSEVFATTPEPSVRAAIVRALGRLNQTSGHATIARALSDGDARVRRDALGVILQLNFFRQQDALLPLVADPDDVVRRRAISLLGEFGVEEAVAPLMTVLAADASRDVRQSAAWALGRIGGTEAREALRTARTTEQDSLVRDAIDIALRMR